MVKGLTGGRSYKSGRRLEHRVIAALKEAKWDPVVRAAGSKGVADIVAFNEGRTALIQCRRDGSLPVADRLELQETARKNIVEAYVVSPKRPHGLRVRDVKDWESGWKEWDERFAHEPCG